MCSTVSLCDSGLRTMNEPVFTSCKNLRTDSLKLLQEFHMPYFYIIEANAFVNWKLTQVPDASVEICLLDTQTRLEAWK